MLKLAVNFLVVVVLLAMGFYLFGRSTSTDEPSQPSSASQSNQLDTLSPAQSSTQDSSQDSTDYLNHLILALDEGSRSSLEQVRLERVQQLPFYSDSVLRELQREGLESMLSRFTLQDWSHWPEATISGTNSPTEARRYVAELWVVNADIARYLETAGLLFRGLFDQTAAGKSFDLQNYFDHIRTASNAPIQGIPSNGLKAPFHPTPEILSDSHFISVFERQRGEQVLRYLKLRPKDYGTQIRLLATLKSEHCSMAVFRHVANLLSTTSLKESPALRRELLNIELENRILEEFAVADISVRKGLGLLYAVGAVDALEAETFDEAALFLNASRRIHPGLPTQRAVASAFRRATGGAESFDDQTLQTPTDTPEAVLSQPNQTETSRTASVPSETSTTAEKNIFSPTDPASSSAEYDGESSWTSTFVSIVVLVGIFFAGAFLFQYQSSKKDLLYGGVETAQSEPGQNGDTATWGTPDDRRVGNYS